jgi:hypothetical protein
MSPGPDPTQLRPSQSSSSTKACHLLLIFSSQQHGPFIFFVDYLVTGETKHRAALVEFTKSALEVLEKGTQ